MVCSVPWGRSTSSAEGMMSVLVTMKNMSNRKITSAIDDMEKADMGVRLRFRAMSDYILRLRSGCRLIEHIHELHGLALEVSHHFAYARGKIVVSKQGADAHYKAGHGGH